MRARGVIIATESRTAPITGNVGLPLELTVGLSACVSNLVVLMISVVSIPLKPSTRRSIATVALVTPKTLHVYMPASDGSGLEMTSVDTRDGTSTPPPLAAVIGDPSEKVIRYLPIPLAILSPPSPSQMRELSGRMNALISHSSTTMLSFMVALTVLIVDNSSTTLFNIDALLYEQNHNYYGSLNLQLSCSSKLADAHRGEARGAVLLPSHVYVPAS